MNNIKKGLKTHNVLRHFRLCHNRDPSGLRFWGIGKVKKHWKGGKVIRHLSHRESYWIYETMVGVPGGLNVDFDIKFNL